MNPNATLTADEFLAAFRTRRACCRALLELSAEQAAHIAADEYSELVVLLQQKQQVLDALLEAGRQPVDVWRAWRTERERLPTPQRQECERALAETEDLLEQLMKAEQSSTELLATRRDVTERALFAANRGGAALDAYGALEVRTRFPRLDVGS